MYLARESVNHHIIFVFGGDVIDGMDKTDDVISALLLRAAIMESFKNF